MVVYGVLATLYLLAFCNSVNMDWFPTLVFSGISLISGGIATWVTNSYFIKQWPVKGQRNWEILLAVTAGPLVCIFLGLMAYTSFKAFFGTSIITLYVLMMLLLEIYENQ